MLDTYDATRKSLIITALGVFRVGIFTTLKMIKQLSLSNLQVAPMQIDKSLICHFIHTQ